MEENFQYQTLHFSNVVNFLGLYKMCRMRWRRRAKNVTYFSFKILGLWIIYFVSGSLRNDMSLCLFSTMFLCKAIIFLIFICILNWICQSQYDNKPNFLAKMSKYLSFSSTKFSSVTPNIFFILIRIIGQICHFQYNIYTCICN